MKRIIVLIMFLSIMLPQVSHAQVKPFRFGLKVAPNVGWISPDSDEYERDGSVAGFSWGFISDFAITENYYVGTGFNINYLNGKYSFPYMTTVTEPDSMDVTGTITRKAKLRYIDLPITLKMKTNKFDQLQVYGQIGFSLGFNIKAKAEDNFRYQLDNEYVTDDHEHDITEEITLLKGSLVLGGGIEYYIDNSTSIIAGITYYNGISNILKDYNTANPAVKQKATAHFIELTLGVIF